MTPELIELSKQAAEVLGVPACKKWAIGYEADYGPIYDETKTKWLAEDSGRCAEIAAERRISTDFSVPNYPSASFKGSEGGIGYTCYVVEDLADHNGDRLKAYCAAVCRAVIEQGKKQLGEN